MSLHKKIEQLADFSQALQARQKLEQISSEVTTYIRAGDFESLPKKTYYIDAKNDPKKEYTHFTEPFIDGDWFYNMGVMDRIGVKKRHVNEILAIQETITNHLEKVLALVLDEYSTKPTLGLYPY